MITKFWFHPIFKKVNKLEFVNFFCWYKLVNSNLYASCPPENIYNFEFCNMYICRYSNVKSLWYDGIYHEGSSDMAKVTLEKSCGGRFLWKIFEIWAGFGQIGNTEKKFGRLWLTFESVFSCFLRQKKVLFFFLNIVASVLKSCI